MRETEDLVCNSCGFAKRETEDLVDGPERENIKEERAFSTSKK